MGTWDYEHLHPVPAVRNSLRRMAATLSGPLCGWPGDRLLVLENEPGPGDLPDRLITAFEDITGVALFYYVGHGQISPEDQLCLGLPRSRPEPHRRKATSLQFADVRGALVGSAAATKIVILDCCFAGLASTPTWTLAGSDPDVPDPAGGAGAYTMAATQGPATAWYEDGARTACPQTFFTRYFIDTIEEGIPGEDDWLRLEALYWHVHNRLAADGRPLPSRRNIDNTHKFPFALNAATLESRTAAGAPAITPANGSTPPRTRMAAQGSRGNLPFTLNPARRTVSQAEAALIPAPLRAAPAPRLLARRSALIAGGSVLLTSAGSGTAAALWLARQPAAILGIPVGPAAQMHKYRAVSVVAGQLAGKPVAVSSGTDGSLYTWDLAARKRIGVMQNGIPDTPSEYAVRGLAVAYPDGPHGDPVLITGGYDASVRLWDLASQREIGSMPALHTSRVNTVATAIVGRQQLILSGSSDATARIWDLASRTQLAILPTASPVNSIATGVLGSVPVAVTATLDDGIQIWALRNCQQASQYGQIGPAMNAGSSVQGVAMGTVNGHPIAVTGDTADYVRFWDLETYEQINPPARPQHSDWVWNIAIGQLGSRTIAVSVGDATGRVWDLTDGDRQLIPFARQEDNVGGLALTKVAGTHYAVTACVSGWIRMWNLDDE